MNKKPFFLAGLMALSIVGSLLAAEPSSNIQQYFPNYPLMSVPVKDWTKSAEVDRMFIVGFSQQGKFAYVRSNFGNLLGDGHTGNEDPTLFIHDLIKDEELEYIHLDDNGGMAEAILERNGILEMRKSPMIPYPFPFDWKNDRFEVLFSTQNSFDDDDPGILTNVVMTSRKKGEKVIGTLGATTTAFTVGRPRAICFVKSPFENRGAVIVARAIRAPASDGPDGLRLMIFGAHLSVGYSAQPAAAPDAARR